MRNVIAIVTACIFLAALYGYHWVVQAKIERIQKAASGSNTPGDFQVTLPDRWMLALSIDGLVYRFRFSLTCLVLAIALGIAALPFPSDAEVEVSAPPE